MKYRYFATYDSIGEDSGICYDRTELNATIADAKNDSDCLYFAWERLDRHMEPVGELKVEKMTCMKMGYRVCDLLAIGEFDENDVVNIYDENGNIIIVDVVSDLFAREHESIFRNVVNFDFVDLNEIDVVVANMNEKRAFIAGYIAAVNNAIVK